MSTRHLIASDRSASHASARVIGRVSALALAIALTGCATPTTMLKNPKTGQVAQCGGGMTGSMLGGMIGHNIEKDNDAKCVREYEAQGFKRTK